ncbi:J domain-containing protein [Treponema sp. HNW]|uniref:J domain-containing protein n=1 Tax=Treponema sp. HNW TaxID=3116654 RepID=UPI003D0DD8BC
MVCENLFDRLGSVLKDYIDDENLQKQNDLQRQNRAAADEGGNKQAEPESAGAYTANAPSGAAEAAHGKKNKSSAEKKHSGQSGQKSRARGIVYKALSAALIEDFTILGLSPDADFQTCKKRYKQLLHLYHPDKYGNGTRKQEEASALTMRIHQAFKNVEKFKTRV